MEKLFTHWEFWIVCGMLLWFLLMKFNGFLMNADVEFRVWVFNLYETDPWFVPRCFMDWMKVLCILLTGWFVWVIYYAPRFVTWTRRMH